MLIIEDRPESVAWFASALQSDHSISSVDTFEEALVRVRGGDYDLIVVSLGMRGFMVSDSARNFVRCLRGAMFRFSLSSPTATGAS